MFIQDQRALFDHLAGWQLVAHVSAETHEPWDGRPLVLPNHVMARPDAGEPIPDPRDAAPQHGFCLDIQLGDRSGDDWVLWPQPRVSLPLSEGVRQSPWGLPTVVPEALLFFKATAYFGIEEQKTGGRFQDEPDFLSLLPHLTEEERHRFRKSIALLHPDHPWLSQIST